MRYEDYPEEDQALMDCVLDQFNEVDVYSWSVDDLEDDEFFFCTKEEVKEVMSEWLDSPGSYGEMARELFAYFDGDELEDEDMHVRDLCWGSVARVGDGRYLFHSNSWSDSGLFLNR